MFEGAPAEATSQIIRSIYEGDSEAAAGVTVDVGNASGARDAAPAPALAPEGAQ